MKLVPYKDIKEVQGNCHLYYGKSGVGKTATILQTAEDPIAYLTAEGRRIQTTLAAINRPDLKLRVAVYEGWQDMLEFLADVENFRGAKTIVIDSMTHLMGIHLADEILEESYQGMDAAKKTVKELAQRAKMSEEGYGTLSRQMLRLMKLTGNLCDAGYDVIYTARDEDRPKYNRELQCGPALMGKDFSKQMKGYFDFIGLVESRFKDKEGNIYYEYSSGMEVCYPPVVSCDDDGSYLSKWTGCKPPGGVIRKPFNIIKMLEIANGVAKNDVPNSIVSK